MPANWELIGGNPAPGDPAAIQGAATAAQQLVTEVEAFEAQLARVISTWSQVQWTGAAADKFETLLVDMKTHLTKVSRAHAAIGTGLNSFAGGLERCQQDALSQLQCATNAEVTISDETRRRDAAEQALQAAQMAIATISAQLNGVQTDITAREQQLATFNVHLPAPIAASVDPELHSLLVRQSDLQAQLAAQSEQSASAEKVVATATGKLTGATRQLTQARSAASSIRTQVESEAREAKVLVSENTSANISFWRYCEDALIRPIETDLKRDGIAILTGLARASGDARAFLGALPSWADSIIDVAVEAAVETLLTPPADALLLKMLTTLGATAIASAFFCLVNLGSEIALYEAGASTEDVVSIRTNMTKDIETLSGLIASASGDLPDDAGDPMQAILEIPAVKGALDSAERAGAEAVTGFITNPDRD